MASRIPGILNHSLRTPLILGSSIGFSAALFSLQSQRHRMLLDSSPAAVSPKDWSFSQYQNDARVPVTSQGRMNPRAIRQLSAGSIMGLVAGLTVSTFSKSLVLIIGLLVAGVQTAEHYGIHLIPYNKLQGYVKGIDLRSAVQDNAGFKISFGLMFALSAFAELPQ